MQSTPGSNTNATRSSLTGSLRFKITLGTILIIGVILLLFGRIAIREQRALMLSQMHAYGAETADFIAQISIIPIQKFSIYQLENYATHIEKGQFIDFCVIYDEQNNPLTSTAKYQATVKTEPNILLFNVPISANNATLGRVELGVNLTPLIGRIDRVSRYIELAFVVELLLIGFAVSFFIHKSLVAPLMHLSTTTRNIAAGDFTVSDQANRSDELGTLATAINEMSSNLQDSYRTLERKVNERTAELMEAKSTTEAVNRHLEIAGAELQALLDNSPVGILFVTADTTIQRVNQEFLNITGYRTEELIGKTTKMLFRSEEDYGKAEKISMNLLKYEETCQATLELLRKDGTPIVCAMRGKLTILDDKRAKGIVWSMEDITTRLKMEEELLKIRKLESIGVLAGGIAHDFNNILVAVIGNISLAERLVGDNHKAVELLEAARNASLRAKDLTTKLTTFAQGGDTIQVAEQLPEIIKEATSFILSGSPIKCVYNFPEDLWAVQMDKEQISQIVHNLILNAQYAMPQGGIVTVSCSNHQLRDNELTGLKGGNYLRLEITDKGSGIAPEHLDKIFDPYFSTKEKDSQKGSGLGLAIVHSIIVKHGGTILVDSTLNQGSTFTLFLPAITQTGTTSTSHEAILPSGKGVVLVMDDEETIHKVVEEMLAYLGYQTLHTYDGQEAIDLYSKHMQSGQPIDAVIMDLTVPGGMGGAEAVKQLKLIDPEARVIVSSGYSDDPVLHDYQDAGFTNIISKPYQLLDLSKVMAQTLS